MGSILFCKKNVGRHKSKKAWQIPAESRVGRVQKCRSRVMLPTIILKTYSNLGQKGMEKGGLKVRLQRFPKLPCQRGRTFVVVVPLMGRVCSMQRGPRVEMQIPRPGLKARLYGGDCLGLVCETIEEQGDQKLQGETAEGARVLQYVPFAGTRGSSMLSGGDWVRSLLLFVFLHRFCYTPAPTTRFIGLPWVL